MWCSQAKKCFPLAHSSQRWPVLSLGPRSPASRSPWSKGWHLSLKTQNIPSQREGGAAMVPGLPPARQTTLVLCRVKLKVGFSRPVRAVLTLAMCPLRSPRPPRSRLTPALWAGRAEASSDKPLNSFPGSLDPWAGSPESQATRRWSDMARSEATAAPP